MDRAKVTLIFPPFSLGKRSKYNLPPLGILYIGSFLRNKNLEVSVIDAQAEGLNIKELSDTVIRKGSNLIGISVMTLSLPVALKLAEVIKQQAPKIKICLGGSHISATLEETLRLAPIDYLIQGEGEYALLKLARALPDENLFGDIENLIYKTENNEIRVNKRQQYISDLDELPFPDLDLIDNFGYINYGIPYANTSAVTSIMASRGCPYPCTFCSAHATHGKKVRMRSVENVLSEVEYNQSKYDIRYFVMKDSIFTLDREWVMQFCYQLKKSKIRIKWRCNARVDKVDAELLATMREAGCDCILFGVESGSQSILDNLRKGVTINQIKKAFQLTRRAGIRIHSTYMIGNPGETLITVQETIDLAKRLNPHTVKFYSTQAYPGTELYKYALREGLLKDPKWYLNFRVSETEDTYLFPTSSGGNLDLNINQEQLVRKAYSHFYFRINFMLKFLYRLVREPYLIIHVIKIVFPMIRYIGKYLFVLKKIEKNKKCKIGDVSTK